MGKEKPRNASESKSTVRVWLTIIHNLLPTCPAQAHSPTRACLCAKVRLPSPPPKIPKTQGPKAHLPPFPVSSQSEAVSSSPVGRPRYHNSLNPQLLLARPFRFSLKSLLFRRFLVFPSFLSLSLSSPPLAPLSPRPVPESPSTLSASFHFNRPAVAHLSPLLHQPHSSSPTRLADCLMCIDSSALLISFRY